MNFLENIFERLRHSTDRPVLQQVDQGKLLSSNGRQVLGLVHAARNFLLGAGLKKGDRCALLAANDVRWAAVDLAAMAEGIIVVPLYSRQAPKELAGMMKDCTPSLVVCGDADATRWCGPGLAADTARRPVGRNLRARLGRGRRWARAHPARRIRPGHDHLHLRHLRRTQGRGAQRRQPQPHAALHQRTARSADGRDGRSPTASFITCHSVLQARGSCC